MTENTLASSSDKPHYLKRSRLFNAIIYGGLAAGLLDGLDASIGAIRAGRSPWRMFQSIASGLIGRSSFEGGLATILLGVSLHFLIAFIWAAIYNGASLQFPALLRRAAIYGAIYGVFVYFFMRMIVMPLSAIRSAPFAFAGNLKGMMTGIIVHIIFVGLPIAFIARRASRAR